MKAMTGLRVNHIILVTVKMHSCSLWEGLLHLELLNDGAGRNVKGKVFIPPSFLHVPLRPPFIAFTVGFQSGIVG
jgi:hypothetical protein